jgi:hypothetical protein
MTTILVSLALLFGVMALYVACDIIAFNGAITRDEFNYSADAESLSEIKYSFKYFIAYCLTAIFFAVLA